MQLPESVVETLGFIAFHFANIQPLIPTYCHLILSALFPIVAGAHASLTRPSSCAKPEKRPRRKTRSAQDEPESEDEEEEYQKMEGLSPSDALMFPLVAGATLAGLYVLIKWLKDAALLNKVLNWYFAIFGVFSVAKLVTDAMDVGHSIVFPKRYADDGLMWQVHGRDRTVTAIETAPVEKKRRSSPLPGALSHLPLPASFVNALWTIRQLPTYKWKINLYLHRLVKLRLRLGLYGLIGAFCGVAAVLWFNMVDKPWFLTNLLGFAFSYNALQIMSPTTFGTGSLILSALFFYDIYFVFYTPMMVTVAKTLDVPIKLVFPRPTPPEEKAAYSMLGLGDVVVPGIMIGLALRFDLYMFYLRQQKKVPGQPLVKPKYNPLTGRWAEYFWTHSWFLYPGYSTQAAEQHPHTTFPKPYFIASVVGYVFGMLATLGVMHIWGHAQPALLYLVPGVLISLWMTALVRGELTEFWNFSEAGDEEGEKDSSKGSTDRKSFFSPGKQEEMAKHAENALKRYIDSDVEEDGGIVSPPTRRRKGKKRTRAPNRHLFYLSIEAPFELALPKKDADNAEEDSESDDSMSDAYRRGRNWTSPVKNTPFNEPCGKRIRTR